MKVYVIQNYLVIYLNNFLESGLNLNLPGRGFADNTLCVLK